MANLNRIKVVLVEKGITGKWLAEKLGKSTCTVSKWCQNNVQPDLVTLDRIAKLLCVDVKSLLNDTEQSANYNGYPLHPMHDIRKHYSIPEEESRDVVAENRH